MWGFVAIILSLWGWHYAYNSKPLGFSVRKITSNFTFHPEWEVAHTDKAKEHLLEITSQPFYYLGAGSQSYAFVSQDQKWVIKFFRMKQNYFYLKDVWHGNRSDVREKRLSSIFEAYKMAFEGMREDAGLVYLHLNKTKDLSKKITVIDRLRFSYEIDLDQVEFVVQERADLIFDRLKTHIKQKDTEQLNASIAEMMHLVKRRIDKGISDHDKAVKHNYGFVGDRAVQLDVGRIFYGEKPRDYDNILERIEKWRDEQS